MYQSVDANKKYNQNALVILWHSHGMRKKLLITLGLIVVYRFLLNVPLPGIFTTPEEIRNNIPSGSGLNTMVEFLDILSGGALLRFSVLGLGLLPFNLAGAFIQILIPFTSSLERRLAEDFREGQRWIDKWTYYLAIPAAIYASFLFLFLISPNCEGRFLLLGNANTQLGGLFTVTIVVILVAGSFFAVWIAELISRFGVSGQGNLILIASGIIGQSSNEFVRLLKTHVEGTVTIEKNIIGVGLPQDIWFLLTAPEVLERLILYTIIFVSCIVGIVYLQGGIRHVRIIYPQRSFPKVSSPWQNSTKESMPSLPLRLTTGVDGLIGSQLFIALTTFYAPLLTCVNLPFVNGMAMWVINIFGEDSMLFGPVVFASVTLLTFFYSDIKFEQQNYGQSLRRVGAQIPGIHLGSATQKYLSRVNRRTTFISATILGLLAVAPWIFNIMFDVRLSLLDGEKILIVVGVIRELVLGVETELRLYGLNL